MLQGGPTIPLIMLACVCLLMVSTHKLHNHYARIHEDTEISRRVGLVTLGALRSRIKPSSTAAVDMKVRQITKKHFRTKNSKGTAAEHTPFVALRNATATMQIPHAMNTDHYIEYMWMIDKEHMNVLASRSFAPADKGPPTLNTTVPEGTVVTPMALCNQHGLWVGRPFCVGNCTGVGMELEDLKAENALVEHRVFDAAPVANTDAARIAPEVKSDLEPAAPQNAAIAAEVDTAVVATEADKIAKEENPKATAPEVAAPVEEAEVAVVAPESNSNPEDSPAVPKEANPKAAAPEAVAPAEQSQRSAEAVAPESPAVTDKGSPEESPVAPKEGKPEAAAPEVVAPAEEAQRSLESPAVPDEGSPEGSPAVPKEGKPEAAAPEVVAPAEEAQRSLESPAILEGGNPKAEAPEVVAPAEDAQRSAEAVAPENPAVPGEGNSKAEAPKIAAPVEEAVVSVVASEADSNPGENPAVPEKGNPEAEAAEIVAPAEETQRIGEAVDPESPVVPKAGNPEAEAAGIAAPAVEVDTAVAPGADVDPESPAIAEAKKIESAEVTAKIDTAVALEANRHPEENPGVTKEGNPEAVAAEAAALAEDPAALALKKWRGRFRDRALKEQE